MEKKKRNIVLEILLCTGIALALLLAYLSSTENNGVFEIHNVDGDPAELAAFSFEGYAGDELHQIRYRWENGTLTRKSYPCNSETICALMDAEKKGLNPLVKYFHGDGWGTSYGYEGEVASAPAPQAGQSPIQSWADVPEAIMEQRFERYAYFPDEENPYGSNQYTVGGTIAEEAAFYAEVTQWRHIESASQNISHAEKSVRAFTGLCLADGPYYYLQWKPKDDEYRLYRDQLSFGGKGFTFLTAEAGDDVYGILATNHNAKGEVFLLHFPSEKMLRSGEEPYLPDWAQPYDNTVYGDAETIAVFTVDRESSILALEGIGPDRLLLVRTEKGQPYWELYDTKGALVEQKPMELKNLVQCESAQLSGLRRKDSAVLTFAAAIATPAEADGTTTDIYEHIQSDRYLVTREEILRLDDTSYADYVDHKNGKTLIVNAGDENNTLALQHTHLPKQVQLSLTVKDEGTGETLYHGILATDFAEDFNKELSSVNLARHAGTLEQQRKDGEIDLPQWQSRFRRMNGDLRPLDGTVDSDEIWSATSYHWNEYYDEEGSAQHG